jgi:methyl coenzyme M reductase beta subunit
MTEMEKKVDLCICLGTSLSGMNADRMAWTPAKRYKKGKGNGTIMINLQETDIDEDCTIRVWAKIDDAFKILGKFKFKKKLKNWDLIWRASDHIQYLIKTYFIFRMMKKENFLGKKR